MISGVFARGFSLYIFSLSEGMSKGMVHLQRNKTKILQFSTFQTMAEQDLD